MCFKDEAQKQVGRWFHSLGAANEMIRSPLWTRLIFDEALWVWNGIFSYRREVQFFCFNYISLTPMSWMNGNLDQHVDDGMSASCDFPGPT